MPITDLPTDEQALWDAIADAMAADADAQDKPDVDAFLAAFAAQA